MISDTFFRGIQNSEGRLFFDSSSEESINTMKSIIHKKYEQNFQKINEPIKELSTPNFKNGEEEIEKPIYEPSIHSFHSDSKGNPSFKDCSEI